MKIKMISLGTKIPNLALMKLSTWHKAKGDEVSLDEYDPDKVYVSSPFSRFKNTTLVFPDHVEVEYGGYGFNNKMLPYEIEHMMPDYSLYDCDYSMGYTTRGCIRKCTTPPCIVPIMEGNFYRNSPIEEFHNINHKQIMLLDNNILADKKWFIRNTDYIIENKLIVKENGFDIRLIDEEIAIRLSELKFEKQIHFALDTMFKIDDKINILNDVGIKSYRMMFYIYGKDDFKDLKNRFDYLISLGVDPFVMPDKDCTKEIKHFARFVNRRIYKVCDWVEYKPNKIKEDKRNSEDIEEWL